MADELTRELVDGLLDAVNDLTRALDAIAAREPAVRDNDRLRQLKEAAEDAAYQVRKNRP